MVPNDELRAKLQRRQRSNGENVELPATWHELQQRRAGARTGGSQGQGASSGSGVAEDSLRGYVVVGKF